MRKALSLPVTLALLVIFVVTSFSHDADAKRRRRRAKKKRSPIINEKVLFDRIGGAKAMGEIIDEWMRLNLADGRVAVFFGKTTEKPDRIAKMRKNLNDQLCELADGPCQYKGKDMDKAHEGMTINEEQFLAFNDNLFRSMDKFNVPEREKNELLGRLGEFQADMVADAKEDATAAKAPAPPVGAAIESSINP